MNARQVTVLEFLKDPYTNRHSELLKASSLDATEGREYFVSYAPNQCPWLSAAEVNELVDAGYLVKIEDWRCRLARVRQNVGGDRLEPTHRWLVWKNGKYIYRPRTPEHVEERI